MSLYNPTQTNRMSRSQKCPYCLAGNDASTGDGQPEAGSVSICAYCSLVSVFIEDLSLRKLTEAENIEVLADPGMKEARLIVVESNRRLGRKTGL